MAADDAGSPGDGTRPQAVLLTFFGGYLLGRGVHVATSSLIDVLGRVGVSEHAARSTVSRMARRGLLHRVRRGRQVYVGLTWRSREVLRDGETRIWRTEAVNGNWDGTWTLLSFSMPESWQSQRHALRARLLWAGFGPLQGGLWVGPGVVDAESLAAGLEAAQHVRVFRARVLPPTDVESMVRDAWDLDAVAGHYRDFLSRWEPVDRRPAPHDALARQLLLQTDWLQVVRRDPRLPAPYLPARWPAGHAQQTFRALYDELDPAARVAASAVLDVIPDEDAADPH